MVKRRAKWLSVAPLVSSLTRWARRIIGGNNTDENETIELSKEEAAWPPVTGQDPDGSPAAGESRSWGPRTGESG
jgi:hypothetical protein